MQILYDSKTDVLYLRLDERPQAVMNRRVSDEAVLDLGEGDQIVGIEIMAASTRLDLRQLLPVRSEVMPVAA
jgi:uncharacterized protein YuzE